MLPRKRIAVIAVHGVADQKPNESNAAIASMLVQHGQRPGTEHGKYTPFESHEVHLPQFPVIPARVAGAKTVFAKLADATGHLPAGPADTAHVASTGAEKKSRRHTRWQIHANRDYIENTEKGLEARKTEAVGHAVPGPSKSRPAEPADAAGELGYQYMHMLLSGHEPDGSASSYVTTVLSGVRRGGPGAPADTDAEGETATDGLASTEEREVDVYEVYWADLSRPAQGALGFFSTAYQLLLHVATLGRQSVDDTKRDYVSWPWRTIRRVQWLAVGLLTLPIPLLNFVLLIVAFGVIPAGAIAEHDHGPTFAICTVLAVGLAYVAFNRMQKSVPARPGTWSLLPFLAAAFGVVLGLALTLPSAWGAPGKVIAINFAWWAVGGAVAYWVGSKYQRLRTGGLVTTMAAYVVSLGSYLWWLGKLPDTLGLVVRMEQATLWTIQFIFVLLGVYLAVLWLCAFALPVLWFVARRDAWNRRDLKVSFEDDPRWSRCRAALRTGRLAIGLSTGALYAFTLLAWAGIFSYTVDRFDVFSHANVETPNPFVAGLLPNVDSIRAMDHTVAMRDTAGTGESARAAARRGDARADSAAIRAAEQDAGSFTVPEYFQGMIAQSITPAAPITLLPALAALFLLLWMALPSVLAEGNATAKCTNPESRHMGSWLSRGLDSTRVVTHLFYAALLTSPAFLILVGVSRKLGWDPVVKLNDTLEIATYAAAGQAGTLIAASALAIVSVLVKFGGSALDVMLDVDNYLRSTPPEATPRARICQRYVSVLRHVAQAEGEKRYDGVVIVAHSLGALISSELLRFLHRQRVHGGDPALARLGFGRGSGPGELPVTLLTMGNPLRQLLSRFFPHRYQWVHDTPDNGTAPLAERDESLPAASGRRDTPDAGWLGVRRWTNLYRSGDYVGRSLWLMEWYHRTRGGDGEGHEKMPLFLAATRHDDVEVSEGCIGAGAHTHYWDMTAPDVSDRIDAMIATA